MGMERLLSPNGGASDSVAQSLLSAQRWLDCRARDILDESDEILHARYQLIYTLGQHKTIESHPDRWTTTQQVLSLVKYHAITIRSKHPEGIEIASMLPGVFPVIRLLQEAAGRDLMEIVVDSVFGGQLPNCLFHLFPESIKIAAREFITNKNVGTETLSLLSNHCVASGAWSTLLLLRGLIAHGIVLYAFKERRFRVDYGLDPTRTLLAVPYRSVYYKHQANLVC
jgi:hypothetical protein